MGNNASDDLFSSHMFAARGSGDPLVGTRIDEYRLEALLGSGGMARVYRAVDVNLNRAVAIKVIDTPYQSDAEYARRFRREAQAIAQLEHPHIVRLYRYGQSDGLFYMAMQFIRGANLSDVLSMYRNEGMMIAPAEASRIIREMGEALDYAHNLGVIHRDVKSSNIMIDQQGRAVLTDFGLAMLASQATGNDEFGSPHYLAPEQAVPNARITPQTDLYSLGVILYEMFVGQRPYSATDPYALAQKHISEPPPAPRSLRPEIGPALEALILKALEKDPRKRYQSGQAMFEALDQALITDPLPALAGVPLIAELVRRRLEIGPITPDVSTKHAPAATGAAETSLPSMTKLSWEEIQRKNIPAVTAVGVGARPAAPRPVVRRWRKTLSSSVVLALLTLLFLCLGASVLAAAFSLRPTQTASDGRSVGRLTNLFGERTSTPTGALPVGGIALTPSVPGAIVPNTGQTLPGDPTVTSVVIDPAASPTAGLQITAIVTTAPPAGITPQATNTTAPTSAVNPPAQPTATAAVASTATLRPTNTSAPQQPTATNRPPATATWTRVPPTATNPPPPTSTNPPPPPTATNPPPPPTATEPPPPPPPTATAPPDNPVGPVYLLSIQRSDGGDGMMVITNVGTADLPLASFQVQGKKVTLSAASWATGSLPPGGCLVTMPEDGQGSVPCSQAGSTARVDKQGEGIFREDIAFLYNGQVVGSCGNQQGVCAVTLQ